MKTIYYIMVFLFLASCSSTNQDTKIMNPIIVDISNLDKTEYSFVTAEDGWTGEEIRIVDLMNEIQSGHYIFKTNGFSFYEIFIQNGKQTKNILRINLGDLVWERTHLENGFNDLIQSRKFDFNSNLVSETNDISTTGLTIFCYNDTIYESQLGLFFPIIDDSFKCNDDTISSFIWYGNQKTYDSAGELLTSISKSNMLKEQITQWFK